MHKHLYVVYEDTTTDLINQNDIKFFEAIAYVSHPQTDSILNLINES